MTTLVSRVPALALALSLVGITACDKEKPADSEAKSEQKTDDKKAVDKQADAAKSGADAKQADGTKTAEPKPAKDGAAPAPTGSSDGTAYFAVSRRGIAKLDAGGWSMVDDDSRATYTKMFAGPDGTVYALNHEAIKKIDGDKLVDVAKFDYKTYNGASYAATNADGSKYYAVGYKGLGVFEGGKWTITEAKAVHADLKGMYGLAVAADNTVWVSSSKMLVHNKAGASKWASLDLSKLGKHIFFSQLSNSPTGDVFVVSGSKLVKLTPEGITEFELKTNSRSYASYSKDLAYNSAGRVLAASSSCELASIDPAKPSEIWSVEKDAYNCQTLQKVALDGQNRAWVSSREGLSVINADKTVTEYPSSTVMEIVGSNLVGMVVTGNGPALPAAGPAHTGNVTGKVLLEGSPVAAAKIAMCASPSYGGSKPCFKSKVKFAGKTNDKGEFTFADVPIGQYNVAVEIDGKWRMNYLSSLATDMKEGATYDVGAVKFTAM